MKKLSIALLAASLLLIPAALEAQEYDVPQSQTPPETVVTPEQPQEPVVVDPVVVPVSDPVVEPAPEEVQAVPEQKVKKAKVKKVKEPKVKEIKEPNAKKDKKTYGIFNHVGVGVSGGLMDGLTANVGAPIGGHFAVRAGYNFLDNVYSYQKSFNLGTIEYGDSEPKQTIDLTNIPVKADIVMKYYGMVDFYLSKKGSFHITAGLFGGADNILYATADLTGVSQIDKEDYAKTSIAFNDVSISTDKNGFIHAGLRAKKQVMPYFGIGWGRVCNLKSWLSLSLDLGVMKTGGFEIYARDFKNKVDSPVTSATVEHNDKFDFSNVPLVGSKLGVQEDLIDKAGNGEFPIFKDFLPCVKIGINIRLF